MIFPERMKKIYMHVLKEDIEKVLKYLSKTECIQLVFKDKKDTEAADFTGIELSEYKIKLEKLISRLELNTEVKDLLREKTDITELDEESLIKSMENILELYRSVLEREEKANTIKNNLTRTREELDTFKSLNVSFEELGSLSFLTYRLGRIPFSGYSELVNSLEGRAVVIPLDKPEVILALSTKKGRWALDSELKKVNFEQIEFPEEYKGLPVEIYNSIEEQVKVQDKILVELKKEKEKLNNKNRLKLFALLHTVEHKVELKNIESQLVSTKNVYVVSGWITNRVVKKVTAELDSLTLGRIAVNIFNPDEVPEVKSGLVKVPVKLKNPKLAKAFEGLIFAYGSPLYGTINPVPFVAVFFVLLFAIMFGDMGQGFVGVIAGIVLLNVKSDTLKKFKKFSTIFIVVGFACMITGFLYGSFFANEEVLIPLTRAVTGIFGEPVDHIITIMPTHGAEKIFVFFGFTIGIGVIINSIGLLINIINRINLKDYYNGIFGKTGLCGASFFWYVVFIAIKAILGFSLYGHDIIILFIPLLLIFLKEPVYNLISGKRPVLSHGFVTFIVEGIVEVIESISYFISNSVSFVRVGAFALSHTVLSLIVFKISDLLLEAPGGIIGSIIIYIIGNAIIIVLEGLIVTIQVVRLQYYEFFSKFFTDVGVEFKPFILKS